MKNKKIIIAGGSGFIGQALLEYFGHDNDIIILGRQKGDDHKNLYGKKLLRANDGYRVRYVPWDLSLTDTRWMQELEGADLVLNLAGKSVNCRYHRKQKKAIMDSRVQSTVAIGNAINKASVKPLVWINAASATIYRDSSSLPNDEFTGIISERKTDNMPANFLDTIRSRKNRWLAGLIHGKNSGASKELNLDFSVQVCKRWEHSFFDQQTPGTRKVALRTAIVLGDGAVLIPYFNLCKYGLGGKQGNGRQMFSWVHIEDLARMIDWVFANPGAEGIYNCAAPVAVTNEHFMKTLRVLTGNRRGLNAPAWMLELGACLIGTETELILKSRWVIPARSTREGFNFTYKYVEQALENIVQHTARHKYHLF